jgi:hypothetical protein
MRSQTALRATRQLETRGCGGEVTGVVVAVVRVGVAGQVRASSSMIRDIDLAGLVLAAQ